MVTRQPRAQRQAKHRWPHTVPILHSSRAIDSPVPPRVHPKKDMSASLRVALGHNWRELRPVRSHLRKNNRLVRCVERVGEISENGPIVGLV